MCRDLLGFVQGLHKQKQARSVLGTSKDYSRLKVWLQNDIANAQHRGVHDHPWAHFNMRSINETLPPALEVVVELQLGGFVQLCKQCASQRACL